MSADSELCKQLAQESTAVSRDRVARSLGCMKVNIMH